MLFILIKEHQLTYLVPTWLVVAVLLRSSSPVAVSSLRPMIRVRLKFDSTPVSYAQKCWFTFDGEKCRLVNDVSHLIASHFSFKSSHGIQVAKEGIYFV